MSQQSASGTTMVDYLEVNSVPPTQSSQWIQCKSGLDHCLKPDCTPSHFVLARSSYHFLDGLGLCFCLSLLVWKARIVRIAVWFQRKRCFSDWEGRRHRLLLWDSSQGLLVSHGNSGSRTVGSAPYQTSGGGQAAPFFSKRSNSILAMILNVAFWTYCDYTRSRHAFSVWGWTVTISSFSSAVVEKQCGSEWAWLKASKTVHLDVAWGQFTKPQIKRVKSLKENKCNAQVAVDGVLSLCAWSLELSSWHCICQKNALLHS